MKKLALAALLLSAAWTVLAAEQDAERMGSLTGVVESTDADHIAAIEARARQLEAKQMDNYEPTAAGHRQKHSHKSGAKHHHKKASGSMQDSQNSTAPAQ